MGVVLGLYRDHGKENGSYYFGFRVLGPMINKPRPLKSLNLRIPSIIPIEGREFINHGSGLTTFACFDGRLLLGDGDVGCGV